MGNDGGSIPTRRELVTPPTRAPTHSELRLTTTATQTYHWSTCPLSKHPLAPPIVSDSLGILYNKDAILSWLLHGPSAFGDGAEILGGRVTSLRDVVELHFTQAAGGAWICPVTRRELGPGTRAVYVVPCGHVFAESAVRELGGDGGECWVCQGRFEKEDVVPVLPGEGEVRRLRERVERLRAEGRTHSLKRVGGKGRKRKAGGEGGEGKGEGRKKKKEGEGEGGGKEGGKKREEAEGGIQNADAARMVARVLGEGKRGAGMSENIRSLFAKKEEASGKNTDFMSRGYTLPESRR